MGDRPLVLALDQLGDDLQIETSVLEPAGYAVESASTDPGVLTGQLGAARGLLTEYERIDGTLLERAPACRAIVTYTVGHDQVDLDAARRRDIVVAHIPGYCTEEVADHAMALVLALCRRVTRADAIVRAGSWGLETIGTVHRLRGRTLGLVGFGRIARAVAARGRAFGLRPLAFDPGIPLNARPTDEAGFTPDLSELLDRSDVISLHVPLLPETRGLIDGTAFAAMKPGAFLVNTSRGGLVDLDAMVHALEDGTLAGAGLDVFETEPPDVSLLDRPNVILTPHMAYYSVEAIEEAKTMAATAMFQALAGAEPPHRLA